MGTSDLHGLILCESEGVLSELLCIHIVDIETFDLQTHIKSVHEGQKFQCPQCEYKATRKGHLQTHIKSVHEGQKFHCPQCEYKATRIDSLQRHIKSVHI